jgi:signal transduction histidine kinase
MKTSFIPHPVRSWRSALVVACLVGTMGVCVVLANEVRGARAALRATAAQTLHDYSGYVGRVIGTELFRAAQTERDELFAPVARATSGPPIDVVEFAKHADSLFASMRHAPDPMRGYQRLDLTKLQWTARGALADTVLSTIVADTMLAMRRSPQVFPSMGVMVLTIDSRPVSLYYRIANDSVAHRLYAYVVTQSRSAVFEQMVGQTIASVPLLPPSFTGSRWDVDAPVKRQISNDSLVGVRIVGVDGSVLYRSSNWFESPYHEAYQFQTGPGGFTIETSLRPGLEQRLVPASIEQASRTLYVAMALLGAFLTIVSFVAFWGEMRQREANRSRALRQLTTGLRHELNNALASVLLEAQLLETTGDASGQVRESAGAIAEQAQRMRDVLRRLDHVDHLPVVDYIEGESMLDLAATATYRAPVPPASSGASAA